jgi:hypothetical protein
VWQEEAHVVMAIPALPLALVFFIPEFTEMAASDRR